MAVPSGPITAESLVELLRDDNKVKLAGLDVDGMLRGKVVSTKKFLSIAKEGFGFCSVIFGWDMHDLLYMKELKISNKENGYHDIIAIPDLNSFRRIPWEDNIPFFLVSFFDPDSMEPVCADPRGLLKTTVDKLRAKNLDAMAGSMSSFFFLLCSFSIIQVGRVTRRLTNRMVLQSSSSSFSSRSPQSRALQPRPTCATISHMTSLP